MPIIHTNCFWDYIINEDPEITNEAINVLTFKEYIFETKTFQYSRYYNTIQRFRLENGNYRVLRFPGGLCKYLSEKLNIQIYEIPYKQNYTLDDITSVANEVAKINSTFEIRDYQLKAALASVNNFRSLIYKTIGSGKTSVMSLVCKTLVNDKILILNNNNFILTQIYNRLISFGENSVSWIQSGEPDYSKRIVLLNTAGSDSRLNKQDEKYLNFLKNEVNTILYDECHHVTALTWHEPIFYTSAENLRHLIGYSGSPFRHYENPYENAEDFRTIAILGEPAFTYEMKDTIADGNIAEPYAYFIKYQNKEAKLLPQFKNQYFMKYKLNIVYNKARNKAGLEMLKFLNAHGIKTLASFNNIKPGQNMMKALKQEGVNSLFICGNETIYEWVYSKRKALKIDERNGTPEDIRKALETNYNIVFGSSVMDEGIDLDIFQAVVIFSAGKTPISGIQRIGRASRKRKKGRNISFVIDFKDVGGEKSCEEHYNKRKQMMKDSGVKILEDVQSFLELIKETTEK